MSIAQKLYDQWPFSDFVTTSFFDITSGEPQSFISSSGMKMEGTVASICDTLGSILLYTNGIYIADSTHKMIENGDGLNPGFFAELYKNSGYKNQWGAVFISVPSEIENYYLIHTGVEKNDSLVAQFSPLYYTTIKKEKGKFSVTSKNQILQTGNLMPFVVVKHGNGRDWWLIQPSSSFNLYDFYLIDSSGVHWQHQQKFDINYYSGIDQPCSGGAQNSISPDGKKLLILDNGCGVLLFDFDRCDGLLSNLIEIKLESTIGSGSSFSPNSRFVYLNSPNSLFQIDTYSTLPKLMEVSKYDEYMSPKQTGFLDFFLASDGKIYIGPNCFCDFLHVINAPDSLGSSCNVGFRQVNLVTNINYGTPMNIPTYLLGPESGSPCDTLTSTATPNLLKYGIKVYPNPRQADVIIDITLPNYGIKDGAVLKVNDILGKTVYSYVFSNYSYKHVVPSGTLVSGYYIASLIYKGELVKSEKFVVLPK